MPPYRYAIARKLVNHLGQFVSPAARRRDFTRQHLCLAEEPGELHVAVPSRMPQWVRAGRIASDMALHFGWSPSAAAASRDFEVKRSANVSREVSAERRRAASKERICRVRT